MPHVIVKLYPGRTEEQKRGLADEIVRDVVEIAKCAEKSVSVASVEANPEEWTEKVYKAMASSAVHQEPCGLPTRNAEKGASRASTGSTRYMSRTIRQRMGWRCERP